jgi:hypothetical protein
MTTRKFGLLGLCLGMAVLAACEETTVLPPAGQDTVIVLDLKPDQATLFTTAPGNTVQLTPIVTGTTNQGATYSSSNTSVATVNASGLVTAVAPGTAVITAVSAARATARDGSTITVVRRDSVPVGTPSISIKSITTNAGGITQPVNTQNVSGQIDVTLNLDIPTGVAIQRVETLVDNQVVCTQSFTSTGEISVDAAMDPVEIVCSINTAAFNATTGAPTFPNGPHTISARVVMPTGTISATTQQQLIFNNTSFITAAVAFLEPGTSTVKACATAGTNPRSIAGAGSLWCGGDVRVTLLGTNFGVAGDALARATVNLTTSGVGVSGAGTCRTNTGATSTNDANTDPTIADTDRPTVPAGATETFPNCGSVTASLTDTDPSNGLSVTFSASNFPTSTTNGVAGVEDIVTISVNSVTVGGQAGPVCVNPDPARNPAGVCGTGAGFPVVGSPANQAFFPNPLRLDNLAPRVTNFDLAPNNICNNDATGPCFVNGAFEFRARSGFFSAVDYGVDSQNTATTFSAGAATTSLAAVTTGASLAETLTATDLFLQAQVRDGLGNVRNIYPTSAPNVTTPDAAQALKFGVDKTAPVIDQAATDAASPPNNGANDGTTYSITFRDDPGPNAGASGFPANPAIVKIEQITPSGTTCYSASSGAVISCSQGGTEQNGFTRSSGTFSIPASEAYYRVTYFVRDAAGNTTAQVVRMTLRDVTAPLAGGVSGPSIITGNGSATFSSQVSDNLDLGDVTASIGYGGVATLQAGPSTTIGTYGPDAFTTSATASATVTNFIRSLENGLGGAITRASTVTFQVRDVAGVVDNDACAAGSTNCVVRTDDISAAVAGGITATNPETSFTATGLTSFQIASFPATLCNGDTAGGTQATPCPTNPASGTYTVTATEPTTPGANPFVRVNLYRVSTPATGSAIGSALLIGTAVGASVTDVGGVRTFTWSITWTPGTSVAPGPYALFAVGVDSKGQGLKSADVVTTVTVD